MKFGAIDIGTNAARLLIGEVCQDEGHSSKNYPIHVFLYD
jgi:exopolyphosphatase/pppGpp-phosphohydrolase